PPAEYGRLAALLRADAFSAADPVVDKVAKQPRAGDFNRALRAYLAVRSASDRLSERFLVLQSLCVANAVRVRRLVFAGRRQKHVAIAGLADHGVDFVRLSVRGVLRDPELVLPATELPDAALARAMDVSDRQ